MFNLEQNVNEVRQTPQAKDYNASAFWNRGFWYSSWAWRSG